MTVPKRQWDNHIMSSFYPFKVTKVPKRPKKPEHILEDCRSWAFPFKHLLLKHWSLKASQSLKKPGSYRLQLSLGQRAKVLSVVWFLATDLWSFPATGSSMLFVSCARLNYITWYQTPRHLLKAYKIRYFPWLREFIRSPLFFWVSPLLFYAWQLAFLLFF